MLLRKTHRRKSGERGSEIIEASFVILPFFAILFLIIDLSLAIFVRCTLQHAVQSGLRYGIANRTNGTDCSDTSIKKVAQYQAIGLLGGSNYDKITIRYYDRTSLALISESAGKYAAGANSEGNLMEVSVNDYSWAPLAPVFHGKDPLVFSARTIGRIDPPAKGIPPCRG